MPDLMTLEELINDMPQAERDALAYEARLLSHAPKYSSPDWVPLGKSGEHAAKHYSHDGDISS